MPFHAVQGEFAAPVRTNKYPREIPELPWYRTAVPQMLMAGLLPFSSVSIMGFGKALHIVARVVMYAYFRAVLRRALTCLKPPSQIYIELYYLFAR